MTYRHIIECDYCHLQQEVSGPDAYPSMWIVITRADDGLRLHACKVVCAAFLLDRQNDTEEQAAAEEQARDATESTGNEEPPDVPSPSIPDHVVCAHATLVARAAELSDGCRRVTTVCEDCQAVMRVTNHVLPGHVHPFTQPGDNSWR